MKKLLNRIFKKNTKFENNTGISNEELLEIIEEAYSDFISCEEMYNQSDFVEGMCLFLSKVINSKEELFLMPSKIPGFNVKFLKADRPQSAYWWTNQYPKGFNKRIKAFSKLINYYKQLA